jgi:hypothetical protein
MIVDAPFVRGNTEANIAGDVLVEKRCPKELVAAHKMFS